MRKYSDCPAVVREFLSYHENIKAQSPRTIAEYHLDLRMFLRFMKLMRQGRSLNTPFEEIDIRDIDLDFVAGITTSDVYEFLSWLAMTALPIRMHRIPSAASVHPPELGSCRR